MADRTVNYRFTGNFTNLAAGLTAMGRSTADLGVKLTALDKNGAKMRVGLTAIGSTAGKTGLVAAAGFAVAVNAAANFEQAMSNVQAATHETSGNMELLRKAAIDAGQATKFSATEAAGAIEELAKAGVSTTDILDGGLTGALDLAAAGNLEVADAAQIAATALTQFRLSGEDVPHVADLLAAGAGKAQGEVSDLSMALKQSGLVASQMGVSIEETTGTLAAFASAGLLGSDAGTSFRTMLLRLANPTTEAAGLMEQLGIQAYNAQGQFVGIESLAGQLAAAFQGQTQAQRDAALATLFGSDAIRAANVLYSQGSRGIADWTNKVNDQGYAAETAAIKMDNLKGDLEKLSGALETAFIGSGSGSQGVLRSLTQDVTKAVDAFNNLSPAAQHTATNLLAITAVTGGGLWFTSKVINGIASTKQALSDLGIEAARTKGALAGIGKGIQFVALLEGINLLDDALDDLFDTKINESTLNRDLAALADGRIAGNLGDIAKNLSVLNSSAAETVNSVFGFLPGDTSFAAASENIGKIDEALAQMVESGNAEQAAAVFDQIQQMVKEAGDNTAETAKWFDQYSLALDNASTGAGGFNAFMSDLSTNLRAAVGSTQDGEKATSGFGVAMRQAAQASKEEAAALEDATKAMRDKTSATLAAFDAETGYRQALKDAREQADKSNAGIKGSTDEALANRSALSQLAAAWNNQSNAVKNNSARYKDARKSFIDTAEAMGVAAGDAKNLADRILEIPKSRVAKVSVDGVDAATAKVKFLQSTIDSLHSKTIAIDIATGQRRAGGGPIVGPGTKTSDSVPVLASNGEFMMSAAAVDHYGLGTMFALNARRLASGGSVDGRGVGSASHLSLLDLGLGEGGRIFGSLKKFAAALDKATDAAEKESRAARDRVQAIRDGIASVRQSIAERFRSDIFGAEGPDLTSNRPANWSGMSSEQQRAWLQAMGAVQSSLTQSPIDILRSDISQAREARSLYRQLRAAGLGGNALLYAQQNASNAELQALLSDPQMLRQYQRLYGVRQEVSGGAGQMAAFQRYGDELAGARKELADMKSDLRDLKRLQTEANSREQRMEKLAKDNPGKTGHAVADALNKGAAGASRKGS